MEQIYTVRVKCRPDPEHLYPSERLYSASTVGGLGLVHLALASFSILMAALGTLPGHWTVERCGGLLLGCGATAAGLTGLLAWKRWYVNRHIRWFLVASTLAAVASFVSLLLTALLIVSLAGDIDTLKRVPSLAHSSTQTLNNLTVPMDTELSVVGTSEEVSLLGNSSMHYLVNLFDSGQNRSIELERNRDKNSSLYSERYPLNMSTISYILGNCELSNNTNETEQHSHVFCHNKFAMNQYNIYLHVLVASFVELMWSLLSTKISWKGLKNCYPKVNKVSRTDGVGNSSSQPGLDLKSSAKVTGLATAGSKMEKSNNPDILENHQLSKNKDVKTNLSLCSNYSNVVRELCRLHQNSIGKLEKGEVGSSLQPDTFQDIELSLPEGNMEYKERVERFLSLNTNS